MNKEYIYIGQYFHYYGKDLGISDKKIGKTINLDQREMQLNRTNGTIGYTYIAAWEVENMSIVETTLHSLLSATRLYAGDKPTEWFDDEDGTLVDSVRQSMTNFNVGIEIDLGIDKDEKVNEIRSDSKDLKVTWNDKVYQEKSARQTLLSVCHDIIHTSEIPLEQLLKNRLFRIESVVNPNSGRDYTKPIKGSDVRVFTVINNKVKIKNLNKLAYNNNLDLKAELL